MINIQSMEISGCDCGHHFHNGEELGSRKLQLRNMNTSLSFMHTEI